MSLLDDLRWLDGEATPGPWEVEWYDAGRGPYVSAVRAAAGSAVGSDLAEWRDADGQLVVAARNVLPLVVELVEAARRLPTQHASGVELAVVSTDSLRELGRALAPFLAEREAGE